ncbi:MAG TPA: hypothetical protein VGE45_02410 [Chloroflexia bacterium]|jgi:hypothetical protein
MARLTPDDIIRIRRELLIKALLDLKKGKMQSARMLVGHDDLGPTLSAHDLMEQLMEDVADARQLPDENLYDWW